MSVIFVAGVHGVGKTTVCKAAAESLGVPHYTASQLIRAEKASAVSEESKLVVDVGGNQRLLVLAARREIAQYGRIILDGHFTIRTASGVIEPIDTAVFKMLGLNKIVVLLDHPDIIVSRLFNRDGIAYAATSIQEHQDAELNHAWKVSKELNVQITEIQGPEPKRLVDAITRSQNGA
jgi:adenylate kinase